MQRQGEEAQVSRRRWVWDDETKELVEVDRSPHRDRSHAGSYVIMDVEPFKSPVDGTVIKSRRHMRDYMKRNDLVHFEAGMSKPRKVDEKKQRQERINVLRDAYEHTRNKERYSKY